MIEPSLAVQSAIRAALLSAPSVTALVQPANIRSGAMRREHLPSIIFTGEQTEFLGYGASRQYLARIYLSLHIWSLDAGADTAKEIAFAIQNALRDQPPMMHGELDEFDASHVFWLRDPDPEIAHGVIKVEAVVRWTL